MSLVHPRGVQPWGNFLLNGGVSIRKPGLGSLDALTDEALLSICTLLSPQDVGRLACASKALYCFALHDDLWRERVLEQYGGAFRYQGSWRQTYLEVARLAVQQRRVPRIKRSRRPLARKESDSCAGLCSGDGRHEGGVFVEGFYSDLLYQPWHCASVPLSPEWLAVESVDRRSGLSREAFRDQYERPNRPVIVTDVVPSWPAASTWTRERLRSAFDGCDVTVGEYDMAFDDYLRYSDASHEEMPLYLFDKHFADKAPELAEEYKVPEIFGDDLFSVLGRERPDWRWLIMGPPRSGSTFHKDPNATSAWNAVVSGAKRWVLLPPHAAPPGVHASRDGADVASPLSLVEWYLNFYEAARALDPPPLECTVRAGEMLFVPRGWWHMALNLEESIAVTHNYVSPVNLPHVLAFLHSRSEALVSGCAPGGAAALYDRFVDALREQRPDVLAAAEAAAEHVQRKRQQAARLSSLFADTSAAADKRHVKTAKRDGVGAPGGGATPAKAELHTGTSGADGQAASGFSFNFSLP